MNSANNQRGFTITPLVIIALLIFVAVFGAWRVWQNHELNDRKSKIGIAENTKLIDSYEECAGSSFGYVTTSNLASHIPAEQDVVQTSFECLDTKTKKSFYSTGYSRCVKKSDCTEIKGALEAYCNGEYRGSRPSSFSDLYQLKQIETLLMDGYVRAILKCYPSSTPANQVARTTVYFSNKSGRWLYLYRLHDSTTCAEMDGLGIPLQIAGTCYDTTLGGFRTPRS